MITRTFLETAKSGVDSYVSVTIDNDQRTLKISDCNRVIHLSFHTGKWDTLSKAQALHKLAKLQIALNLIEKSLIDG